MAYRISVPEYREISDVYMELCNECVYGLQGFYRGIEENCRRTGYKPMVDFTNDVCRFYYGDFKSHLFNEFRTWESSEYSLDNLTRRIGAGEDAARTGKQYMQRIEDSLNNLFAGSILDEIHLDTSHPVIDNQLILQNQEYINTFLHRAESARDSAVSQITFRASENDAFSCIIGIVRTTGDSMIGAFHEMLSQVANGEELFGRGAGSSINPARTDRGREIDVGGSLNWRYESPFL